MFPVIYAKHPLLTNKLRFNWKNLQHLVIYFVNFLGAHFHLIFIYASVERQPGNSTAVQRNFTFTFTALTALAFPYFPINYPPLFNIQIYMK